MSISFRFCLFSFYGKRGPIVFNRPRTGIRRFNSSMYTWSLALSRVDYGAEKQTKSHIRLEIC